MMRANRHGRKSRYLRYLTDPFAFCLELLNHHATSPLGNGRATAQSDHVILIARERDIDSII